MRDLVSIHISTWPSRMPISILIKRKEQNQRMYKGDKRLTRVINRWVTDGKLQLHTFSADNMGTVCVFVPAGRNRMVYGPQDVFEMYEIYEGVNDKVGMVRRRLFKYTDCGASCTFEWDGVVLHSIVEGADVDCTPIKLTYPFAESEWWRALEEIEAEAADLWFEWSVLGDPLNDPPIEHPDYSL